MERNIQKIVLHSPELQTLFAPHSALDLHKCMIPVKVKDITSLYTYIMIIPESHLKHFIMFWKTLPLLPEPLEEDPELELLPLSCCFFHVHILSHSDCLLGLYPVPPPLLSTVGVNTNMNSPIKVRRLAKFIKLIVMLLFNHFFVRPKVKSPSTLQFGIHCLPNESC